MSRFAPKFGPEVDDAILEARAAEMAPSTVLRKLHAGTLSEELGPIEIKRRTFYDRWAKAKRELTRAREREKGPRLLDVLAVQIVEGWEDLGPDQIAEELDLTPAYVAEILDAIAERSQ